MDSTTVIDIFIDTLRSAGRSEAIIKTRRSALHRLVRETGIELLDQTPHSIRRHLQFLAPTMSAHTLNYIRSFYRWAYVENLLGLDPSPPLVRKRLPTIEPLDPDELVIVEKFVAHLHYRNLADASVTDYLRQIRQVRITLGRLADVELVGLEQYLLDRFEPSTRRTSMSRLRVFYKWAYASGHVPHNPAESLESPRVPAGLPRPISEPDLHRALRTASPNLRTTFLLAGWAGLRAGEIAGLHTAYLDIEGDRPNVRIVTSKGRREDVVPLSGWLTRQLRLCPIPAEGWVHPNKIEHTRHREPSSVGNSAGRHLKTLGINGGLHTLRHRFGTQVYLATRDLRVTQELMRHRNPSTTARYTSIAVGELADAVDLLPAL